MDTTLLHKYIEALPVALQEDVAAYVAFLYYKHGQSFPSDNTVEEKKLPLKFGAGKGIVKYVAADFDEPLEHFSEYMP